MSDEELRALERAAVDVTSRVRYAEALLRLGRTDEAIAALVPAAHDPEVRRRIGRFPAPVVPILRRPLERWRTAPGTSPHDATPFLALHVSPLGLVATSRPSLSTEITRGVTDAAVFDAETGGRRAFALEGRPVGIYGHVVLTHSVVRDRPRRQALAAFDIVTGERLWSDEHEATLLGVGVKSVRVALDGAARELSWPLPERPPHVPAPGEETRIPDCAPKASIFFETPAVAYGVVEIGGEDARTGSIYARARSPSRERLWRFELPGVHAVAPVGRRLYALVGAEVVCLE